jgi:hypothetical protein
MVHPQNQQRPQSILTPLRQFHAKAKAIIPTDLVKYCLKGHKTRISPMNTD